MREHSVKTPNAYFFIFFSYGNIIIIIIYSSIALISSSVRTCSVHCRHLQICDMLYEHTLIINIWII